MEMNEVLDKLPRHLLDLVIDQPYTEYTAQDHAVWRFVMRQNVDFLQHVAHDSYLEGLRKTGISIDSIPHMYGMNRILKEIGWAAVAVDGFIPPAAFMEFQAYNVLVIAADIRPIDQIEYTPAPDIIHEAAGHAPIIAHEDYAEYLKEFGRIGAKAFSSAMDYEQYEAIRHLSILKADPYTAKEDIERAEKRIEDIENNMGAPSEMSRIRNLHWWTVEFGLVGDLENPKIYGAGLLSSIGESYNCLQDHVKKIPYTVDAANYSFDITSQQPHLFVTPSFDHLNEVLQEFADGMALRTGGMNAVEQAIRSENTGTLEWSSGLQVSGTFSRVISDGKHPLYLETASPASLAFEDKQLDGLGKNQIKKFGSPLGNPKGLSNKLWLMSGSELQKSGFAEGEKITMEYPSGVKISGVLRSIVRKQGKNLLFVLSEPLVEYQNEVLHNPEDGLYYLAIGDEIVSGYSGPADADAWELSFNPPEEKTHKIEHNDISKSLHQLYQQLREIRKIQTGFAAVPDIWEQLKEKYPDEWLIAIELLELSRQENMDIEEEIFEHLEQMQNRIPEFTTRINNGIKLVDSNITNKSIGVGEV